MRHHRVVDEPDPHALAVAQRERLGGCERDAVERPHEPFHVARQMQLDRALGLAAVGIGEQRAQVGIREHAPAVVAQADAGIGELRLRRRRLHVDAGVAPLACGMLGAAVAALRRRACGVRGVIGASLASACAACAAPWPMSAIVR